MKNGFDGLTVTSTVESLKDYPPGEFDSRWICEFHPKDSWHAGKFLESLAETTETSIPDMIVFHNDSIGRNTTSSLEDSLGFLREILPLSAQFLEEFRKSNGIGTKYGRLNAHGKPLDDHVIGICHHFPNHSTSDLAVLLDVFLPTRLALSPLCLLSQKGTFDADEWEAAVQNTDVLLLDDENSEKVPNYDRLMTDVWNAQELDGADETYAICRTEQEAINLQKLYERRA